VAEAEAPTAMVTRLVWPSAWFVASAAPGHPGRFVDGDPGLPIQLLRVILRNRD
jgi:hypothetical protein